MLPGRGSRRCWADGACIPAGAGASVGVLVTARFPRWIPAGAGAEVVLDGGGLSNRSILAVAGPAAAVGRRVMSLGVDVVSEPESHLLLVPFPRRTVFQPSVTKVWYDGAKAIQVSYKRRVSR